MKKSFSLLKKLFAGVVLVAVMAACSAKLPTDAEVAQKIADNQTLSEADYTTMIDYCGKYAEEAQAYYDVINAQPNDSTAEYNDAASNLANLYAKYTYIDQFRQQLLQAQPAQLGSDNEKKLNDFSKYEAFPLPGSQPAGSDVVGVIEDMPSEAVTDSTGVIATGDGEAVDNQVK